MVLSAAQVVEIDGDVLEKPADANEAASMLNRYVQVQPAFGRDRIFQAPKAAAYVDMQAEQPPASGAHWSDIDTQLKWYAMLLVLCSLPTCKFCIHGQ